VSAERPRVLHVATTDMSLELLLRPQFEAFIEAGYEIITASAPGRYVASLEAAGIRHIALDNATREMDPRRDAKTVREMVRLFRRERPHIVHTHNPKPGWFGRVTARAAGVKGVVNTVHGLYATTTDSRPRRAVIYGLERAASAFSDVELVQNPEDVRILRRLGIPAHKLVTLGNGIDLDRFVVPTPQRRAHARQELGLADDEIAIGAVGRLVWEKGLREVFDAAGQLPWRIDNARVLVVGPLDPAKPDGLGPRDLARIESESGVRFLGERSDMELVYHALDIYALASHREGFPRAAMEAAASGVPVVASDIRGSRQVVEHGRTGLLFPVRDACDLADAITLLAKDPRRRAEMGAAARQKAELEFDQRRVIDLTLATYEELLAR